MKRTKELENEKTLLLNPKYTKKQWELIFNNIVVIIDTREKENKHITNVFDSHNIRYINKKLDFGDYSFYLDEIRELDIGKIDFSKKFVIERKNSINELSINVSHKRKQFENELEKALQSNTRLTLMVENNTYEDILRHNYMSKLEPSAFTASLMTFQARYKMNLIFLSNVTSANYIFNSFKYYLREYIMM